MTNLRNNNYRMRNRTTNRINKINNCSLLSLSNSKTKWRQRKIINRRSCRRHIRFNNR